MEKKRYYTISELKESCIFLNKKIPPFGWIITFLITIILIFLLSWSIASQKTYVVKASGLLTDSSKENIMNTATGSISKIYYQEGDFVKKDETIISLLSNEINLQIEQLQTNVKFYKEKIDNYLAIVEFINGFRLDVPESRINPFPKDDPTLAYYYGICKSFIDYVDQNEGEEIGIDPDIHLWGQEDCDDIKFNYLCQQNIYSNLESYQKEWTTSSSQLKSYKENCESYLIKAPKDGYIHLTPGLLVGTYLSSSTLLCTISDNDSRNYFFEVSIQTAERAKVKVGDDVEIGLTGVSQYDYGVIKGKLINISNDISYSNDGKEVYYIGQIKPQKDYLEDKHHNKINITLGMMGECRIKYDETSYFSYFIEQLLGKLR